MVAMGDLKQINNYEWEIPTSFRGDMRVPVRLFVTRELLEQAMRDKSLEQAVNAATLPGLVGYVTVMPDVHQGYGFPIGGVAATRYPEGVISPGSKTVSPAKTTGSSHAIPGDRSMSVRPLDDVHRKALFEIDKKLFEKLEASHPAVYERIVAETKALMERYGVPSFGGSFGGLWDEDCP